jgi:hypothetical protein
MASAAASTLAPFASTLTTRAVTGASAGTTCTGAVLEAALHFQGLSGFGIQPPGIAIYIARISLGQLRSPGRFHLFGIKCQAHGQHLSSRQCQQKGCSRAKPHRVAEELPAIGRLRRLYLYALI